MRRPRVPRPSPLQLSVALTVLAVLAGLAVLVVPVRAAFADDPLLRLQPFSPGLDQVATEIDCGTPVGNLGRRTDGISLYGLARDGACRDAAAPRVATAVAVTAVIGLLGLVTLAGNRTRELTA